MEKPELHPVDIESLPHVVVVGGGFGGVSAVKALANQGVRVTLIDRHNFHTFMPLLYQVATAGLEPADVAYPIRTIFGHAKNVRVRHARVSAIDREANTVTLEDGTSIGYDYLIVATGAVASYFSIPGAQSYSMPLYTLANARRLRNRLLRSLEDAEVAGETSPQDLDFVVVGGGPTGVETAGALSELVQIAIKRDGMRIDPARVKIRLVDVAPRLLTAFPERASNYALHQLRAMGVSVELDRSVVEAEAHAIRFADGERLEAAVVVWAGGITVMEHSPNNSTTPQDRTGERWWVVTCACRVVTTCSASGMLLRFPRHAATARSALNSRPWRFSLVSRAAKEILLLVGGQPATAFHYVDKGIMATIGRRAAVAKIPHVPTITGTLGWMAWLGLHLFYLVGFRNRLRVFINWTWRYFDWPSGPRLIVADAETAK